MAAMTLNELGEDALVRQLTASLTQGRSVVVGPGDDCAVVKSRKRGWLQLLKADCVVEGVHFLADENPHRVGWKALARAVSDMAACAGRPDHALVTIAAPATMEVSRLQGIYEGLRHAAETFGISIVGGETARSPAGLLISVALTGSVRSERLVTRSGGQPGDAVMVSGRLGGSIGGRHLDFMPRIREARWLAKHFDIHAMMDLSDGLGCDLPRLADASAVGYWIDRDALPLHDGCTIEQAVRDGEDYELLFTIADGDADELISQWAKKFPDLPLTRIGRLEGDFRERTEIESGFSHFSGCQTLPSPA